MNMCGCGPICVDVVHYFCVDVVIFCVDVVTSCVDVVRFYVDVVLCH